MADEETVSRGSLEEVPSESYVPEPPVARLVEAAAALLAELDRARDSDWGDTPQLDAEAPLRGALEQFLKPPSAGEVELLREFRNSGLLAWVNDALLHRYGFALGINVKADADDPTYEHPQIVSFSLYRSDDPEGILFENSSRLRYRKRLAHYEGARAQ